MQPIMFSSLSTSSDTLGTEIQAAHSYCMEIIILNAIRNHSPVVSLRVLYTYTYIYVYIHIYMYEIQAILKCFPCHDTTHSQTMTALR